MGFRKVLMPHVKRRVTATASSRRFVRFKTDPNKFFTLKWIVGTVDHSTQVWLLDESLGGCRIMSKTPIAMDGSSQFELETRPNQWRSVSICWEKKTDTGYYEYGLNFG